MTQTAEFDAAEPFDPMAKVGRADTAGNDAWWYDHENEVTRIAQIIVDAGCKPYAAAEALISAGYVIPPAKPCPTCGAQPSGPCVDGTGRRERHAPHFSRTAATSPGEGNAS